MAENDYISRIYTEHGELNKNIEKLKDFILSDKYEALPDIDKKDLKEQLSYMKSYFDILSRRVSRSCGNA